MTAPAYSSFTQWYTEGHLASYVRSMKSPGGILNLLEAAQPAGDMSDPAVPDLILYQDLLGGNRVSGNMGGGRFDVTSERGGFYLAAPNFASEIMVETKHQLRSLSFPMAQWQKVLDEAADRQFSFDHLGIYGGTFASPSIRSAFQRLWGLCDEEGAPSRLLAQAAGCEILAELCRLGGTPFTPAKGGLAPWAERRSLGAAAREAFGRHQPRRAGSRSAALTVSFRTHVQAKRRRAATGLPDATENRESLRTPRANRPSDHRDRPGGRILVEPGTRPGIRQTSAHEPFRLSSGRS